MFLTELTDGGFVGLYEPTIDDVMDSIRNQNDSSRRRKRAAGAVGGIPNPVTCIELGTTIMFSVSQVRTQLLSR